jgi:coenzyme PQQ synthesis protein D (PqqD)
VTLEDLILRSAPKASDRYERASHVKWRAIEGLIVLIDANEGQLIHLNDMGSRIWQRLDGEQSVDQILSELENAFDAPAERLRKDTLKFLRRLALMELIRKVGSLTL